MLTPVRSPRSLKRALDIALGSAGLLAATPVAVVAGLAVALDDGAPVLFRQERVGLHGKPFTLIKLRTMRDGRATRVGRWLRRSGFDELPQLLNVLRGDMSLVGPRPLTMSEVRRLGWDDPRFEWRFRVAQGLTGPVQVLGAVSAASSAAIERAYVRRGRIETDLAILGVTVIMLVAGRDRVRRVLRTGMKARVESWMSDHEREGSGQAPLAAAPLGLE
jgi:lipopolysaccharide/colanic/teichoic acid biosynthesis glycosyltransferase